MRLEQRVWLLCFIAVFMLASVMVPMPAQAQREGGGGGGERGGGRSCVTFPSMGWYGIVIYITWCGPDWYTTDEIIGLVSEEEDAILEEAEETEPEADNVWCLIEFETGGIFCIGGTPSG